MPRAGLPVTIWVSPGCGARHDARVKVCTTPDNRTDPSNTAVVLIPPHPALWHGASAPKDLAAVQAWIGLNAAPLLDDRDGEIDTFDLVQRSRKV